MHDARCLGFAATLWLLAGCGPQAGAAADPDANASCDPGPLQGWSCPSSYSTDPAQLCASGPHLQIHTADNGVSRNITFDAVIAAWGCCYDANGAFTGEHIRDDVYHSCWGGNGEPSNTTSIGMGCWIALGGPEIDCSNDGGAPDAGRADGGRID